MRQERSLKLSGLIHVSRLPASADFLVHLAGGTTLATKITGTDSPYNEARQDGLNEWMKAINAAGGFGR